MGRASPWRRFVDWLFGRKPKPGIAKADTLVRRLDSAVRGSKERDLLRGAEESLRRGRVGEALRAYRAAVHVFIDRGAYSKAAAVLSTLRRIDRDNPEVLEQLAHVHTQLGHPREADAYRQEAALMLEAAGRVDEASKVRARAPASGSTTGADRLAPLPSPPSARPSTGPSAEGFGAPPPARAVSKAPEEDAGPLDLGDFEPDRPVTLPPEALAPVETAPTTPAETADVAAHARLPQSLEQAPTDPSREWGRANAGSDASYAPESEYDFADEELSDEDVTLGPAEAARVQLSLPVSPPAPSVSDEQDFEDEDDEEDGADQTLFDPEFLAAHKAQIDAAVRQQRELEAAREDPRGATTRPRHREAAGSNPPPPSNGGPRGLSIPSASTMIDPRK